MSLIIASFSSSGVVEPSSHLETVWRVTPSRSPSCSCDQPLEWRSSVSFSENFILLPPGFCMPCAINIPQSALNVYQFPFEVCQPNLTSALLCGFQTCDRISDPPRLQQKVLDFLGIMWYIISSTFPAGNRRIIRIIYDMEVNNVR